MRNLLLVIDMQTDFVDGALGTAEAVAIVDNVVGKIENFDGCKVYNLGTGHGYSVLDVVNTFKNQNINIFLTQILR